MTSSEAAKAPLSKMLRVASITVLALDGALVFFLWSIRFNLDLRKMIPDYVTPVTWVTLFLSGLFFLWVMRTKANEFFGGILLSLTLALMLFLYFSPDLWP